MKRLLVVVVLVSGCAPSGPTNLLPEGLRDLVPGSPSGPDAHVELDGGGPLDAGVDAGSDAGCCADAGSDAGEALDAGALPNLPAFVEVPFEEQVGDLIRSQGVADGGLTGERVSAVRGRVLRTTGAPLPMVRVTCLNHPEWGARLSDVRGEFTFVVNGGGELVFTYEAAGFLTVQRRVEVPWNEYVWLPDVALTPLDARATMARFGPGAPPMQVLSGSAVSDAAGTRTASVLVAQGTSATVVSTAGVRTPLLQGTFRATEYTVGPSGPSALPGALPPTSAYTYAVELSFDETLDAAAVEFDRPVALYVDDFRGFPAGTRIPVASTAASPGAGSPPTMGSSSSWWR